ncbi:MAG: NADH-quinone oxidoreductase subunit C, partial [Desulfobacterales bacterium]
METGFLQIGNGEAINRDRIPHLGFDDFRSQALAVVEAGGKVVHYFAYQDGSAVKLLAVLRTDRLQAAGCDAPEAYPSMTLQCEPFHMFEREIAEQFGIRPEGHPWLKMVRYHANELGRPDVFGNDY